MSKINKSVIRYAKNIFFIVLGTFIMGSAYNIFYAPNDILLGGFSGIASIICHFLAMIDIILPISAVYLILNGILFICALKFLGKEFAINALIGIGSYSLFLEVCKFAPVSQDLLLCSIYGGVLTGIGLGLTVRGGGSTGGSDMLGCIFNKINPRFSVGLCTVIVDAIVIFVGLFVYGLNLTLYALIGIFIMGKMSDFITEGPKSVRAFYIISNKSNEISRMLISKLNRSVTDFEAYGRFSGNKLDVLLCLVNGYQERSLKDLIYNIDKDAFMFSVPVKEAMGRGFLKLEKSKNLIPDLNYEDSSVELKAKSDNMEIIKKVLDNDNFDKTDEQK